MVQEQMAFMCAFKMLALSLACLLIDTDVDTDRFCIYWPTAFYLFLRVKASLCVGRFQGLVLCQVEFWFMNIAAFDPKHSLYRKKHLGKNSQIWKNKACKQGFKYLWPMGQRGLNVQLWPQRIASLMSELVSNLSETCLPGTHISSTISKTWVESGAEL